MDAQTRERIEEKNRKLIAMVVERAQRDFPDDIALIGLTGSFSTGDYHEKSDLDLIIINNTQRGWQIADAFLYDGVGYDIYCTEWNGRLKEEANLDSPMVSHLLDLQILYCAKPEYAARFAGYQQRARERLAKPIGADCLGRAVKSLDQAKQHFAQMMLEEGIGGVRYAAGLMVYELIQAVIHMNNTYLKRGIRRYWEEIRAYSYVPEGFEALYCSLLGAKTVEELRSAAKAMLLAAEKLYQEMVQACVPAPVPTKESLAGTYEELFCNYYNKMEWAVSQQDPSYVFLTMVGAQAYAEEMTREHGMPAVDLMKDFDCGDLEKGREAFLRVAVGYEEEYARLGLEIQQFSSFDALYRHYMKQS